MTTVVEQPVRDHARAIAVVIAASVGAGIVLGVVDLVAQHTLPYPWANLANSSALWALAAFAGAAALRTDVARSTVAGVVLLLVAVETYYAAAVVIYGDSTYSLTSPTTVAWLVFGVLAGTVLGAAGGWWRGPIRWKQVLGAALAAAVVLAEAGLLFHRSAVTASTDDFRTALIEAGIAMAVIAVTAKGGRRAVETAVLSLPLAGLGVLALLAGGFGG